MTRELRRDRFDIDTRIMLLEEDVDHLEGVAKESAARVTRLLVAAAGLLVSVSTAIIVLFVTGAVGK